jgi:hypothetical protein
MRRSSAWRATNRSRSASNYIVTRLEGIRCVENQDEVTLAVVVDAGGRLRISKSKVKGTMPTTTEEFRSRLRLEGNTWLFSS